MKLYFVYVYVQEADHDAVTCESCYNEEPMEELFRLQTQLEVLHAHYGKMLDGIIDPERFGAKLYTKRLISNIAYRDVTTVGITDSEKISMLLQAIDGTIGFKSNGFEQFLDVLRDDITTAPIASSIKGMLGKD